MMRSFANLFEEFLFENVEEKKLSTFELKTTDGLVLHELRLQGLFLVPQFTLQVIFQAAYFVVFLGFRSC